MPPKVSEALAKYTRPVNFTIKAMSPIKPRDPNTYSAAYVFLINDGKIFLARRINTGWHDGDYDVTAGHIEKEESGIAAALREAKEEMGVAVAAQDLQFAHILHRFAPQDIGEPRIYADIFFAAKRWQGTPYGAEDGITSDHADWFSLDTLPENIVPHVKQALDNYRQGIFYSEFGWDEK